MDWKHLAFEHMVHSIGVRGVVGFLSENLFYPLAQKLEHRDISSKIKYLEDYYALDFKHRERLVHKELIDVLSYAKQYVPYYRDLFKTISFDIEAVRRDIDYFKDFPILTKSIINEHRDRLISECYQEGCRRWDCKTGGSTGVSAHIYYDVNAADWSSAVTLFCRRSVGASLSKHVTHFACKFNSEQENSWFTRGDLQCVVMNRSNIFFSSLTEEDLFRMYSLLKLRRPYLIHEHPSTIFTLADFIEKKGLIGNGLFKIFESSGELLEDYQRFKIENIFKCKIVNRYGLAEFGVIGYERQNNDMLLLDSEGYGESIDIGSTPHLVFTGFHNRYMPLIRYETGDLAEVIKEADGYKLTSLTGRIHDVIEINGVKYATHTIMDIFDHQIKGIKEFQILHYKNSGAINFNICPESFDDSNRIISLIKVRWGDNVTVSIVPLEGFVRVGHRNKFRHLVELD